MGRVEKSLGLRVAELRRLAGLTQAGLAEKIGVATETISRIERGVAIPGLQRLEAIATALDVDISNLFFNSSDPPSPKDQAIERLVSVVRRGNARDVTVLAEVAALLLDHFGLKS